METYSPNSLNFPPGIGLSLEGRGGTTEALSVLVGSGFDDPGFGVVSEDAMPESTAPTALHTTEQMRL